MIELIQNVLDKKVIDAVSMASGTTSSSINIQNITCYAIQCYWTGFSAGGSETIYTEASNDDVNYTTIDAFIPSGTSNSNMLNVEKAGYRFVRIRYVPNGGTGTLSVTVSGKVI